MHDTENIPQHVAIIMDGNGRWARARGLPRIAGHRAGVRAVEEAIEGARELGVKVITLYAFSSENWKRPRKEVSALLGLLGDYIDKEAERLNKNNISLTVIGRLDELPAPLVIRLTRVVEATRKNTGLILNIAINYGARSEITDAVRAIAGEAMSGRLSVEDIDEGCVASHLYTRGLPDPDLLIRTSGEFRVSNFLLWQISYSEICVLKKMWPDFKKSDFKKVVIEYQNRERRFGG